MFRNPRVPGAAQHAILRRRPGIAPIWVPDQRCTVTRCTASGTRTTRGVHHFVIPGPSAARNPESRSWFSTWYPDSGSALSARPGMTKDLLATMNISGHASSSPRAQRAEAGVHFFAEGGSPARPGATPVKNARGQSAERRINHSAPRKQVYAVCVTCQRSRRGVPLAKGTRLSPLHRTPHAALVTSLRSLVTQVADQSTALTRTMDW